jgi:hypothetical protein
MGEVSMPATKSKKRKSAQPAARNLGQGHGTHGSIPTGAGCILFVNWDPRSTPGERDGMDSTRRTFLTAAGAAAVQNVAHAQDHDHDHEHQAVPSDLTLRVKALESLLVEKGLVDRAALDALVDTYELFRQATV